jgi:methyl-accepting chemotaxis protein
MRIPQLKISTRLHFGFGLIIAMLVVLAATAWYNGQRAAQASALNRHSYETLIAAHQLQEAVETLQAGQRGYALTGRDEWLAPYRQGQAAFAHHLETLQRLTAAVPDQQERLARIGGAYHAWLTGALDPALRLRKGLASGSTDLAPVIAAELQNAGRSSVGTLHSLLAELERAESATLAARQADADDLQALTAHTLILGTLLACALALGGTLWLAGNISGPLSFAVKVAKRVATGDLTARIEVRTSDETGELMGALRDMNDALLAIVRDVRGGTVAIRSGASEIASGNHDLSARTEQQASSLEETASSMEELTATVKHNADNTRQASQMAAAATDIAQRGGAVVAQVVDRMAAIDASAQKIVDIIAVIDSIAFQTNILALNAAVEAARAGEQGRGFAVVANEVRTLAQRSASAAGEIKGLIAASVEEVAAGSKLVRVAGATMDEIVTSVRQVSDLINEISSAGDEQRAGIEQVNASIMQMEQMTQQNAALVEEAAAAASAMEEQAQRLNAAVQVFQVEAAAEAPRARLRAEPRLLAA